MATERQIAANRCNAQKSTGPRSAAGKKRSSSNAFRHGLSKPLTSVEFASELDTLAGQIAGDRKFQFTEELARSAAEADLELARIRHLKTNLIECIAALRHLDSSQTGRLSREEVAHIMREVVGAPFGMKSANFPAAALLSVHGDKPEPTAEAIRLALPELERLARYENRAAAWRKRAFRAYLKGEHKS